MSSPAPILSVRNLSVTFMAEDGDLRALQDLSFSIERNTFVCVLGPSGCGKSTLLRVLSGLLTPNQGEVRFHGQPMTAPQREIGLVFQRANLMPWRPVLENISLPLEVQGVAPDEARQRALEMIGRVGLEGFERSLPRDLSGGMAQRVAIARALVYDPEVLLLDEPFGALDALTRERMSAELLRLWEGRARTAIMVTHAINEAVLLADRVLVLSPRPGRLRLDLAIDLPRPRAEEMSYTPEFIALTRTIRGMIGQPA